MEGLPKENELPFDLKLGKLETILIPHNDEEFPESMILRTFPHLDGKLVREETLPEECEGDIECITGFYANSKEDFDVLKRYGFDVVDHDTVLAKNEKGVIKAFTVVDKIEGEILDYMNEHNTDTQAKETIRVFCEKVARYYTSAQSSHWVDFALNQIMYGTKVGEQENKCWIIDVGPGFFAHNNQYIKQLVLEEMLLIQRRIPSMDLSQAIKLLK